jgi:NADPH:quinone reductase-like Zn-dependent oxidoreductase
MEQMMKAVVVTRFGGPEALRLETVPRPRPQPGDLLVRVEAAAVNPIDWKLREGLRGDMPMPFIPGGDFCGSVEEVGLGATGYEQGDAVFGVSEGSVGADAEFVSVPTINLALKPRSQGPVEASSIPLAGMTAWQGLFVHGGLTAKQSVLILGASGGVGGFAVQLAKRAGATVMGTASTENIPWIRELGCDTAIDYKNQRFEALAKDVDLCLDLIGGDFQSRAIGCVKRGGRLVSTVGQPDEALCSARGIEGRSFVMKPDSSQLRELSVMLEAGDLRTRIAKVLPLERAAEAEELSRLHKIDGKIVLQVHSVS